MVCWVTHTELVSEGSVCLLRPGVEWWNGGKLVWLLSGLRYLPLPVGGSGPDIDADRQEMIPELPCLWTVWCLWLWGSWQEGAGANRTDIGIPKGNSEIDACSGVGIRHPHILGWVLSGKHCEYRSPSEPLVQTQIGIWLWILQQARPGFRECLCSFLFGSFNHETLCLPS